MENEQTENKDRNKDIAGEVDDMERGKLGFENNIYADKDQLVSRRENQNIEKLRVVLLSNAVVQPFAVVVELTHAAIAHLAMLRGFVHEGFANLAIELVLNFLLLGRGLFGLHVFVGGVDHCDLVPEIDQEGERN